MAKKPSEKVDATTSPAFNAGEPLAEVPTEKPTEAMQEEMKEQEQLEKETALPSKTPVDPSEPDDPFKPVNTGDFEVWDVEAKEELIARYVGTEQYDGFEDDNGNKKDMLKFVEHGTEKTFIADPSYYLFKFFVERVSETKIDWDKNPTFKIKFTGKEDIGKGRTVKNFTFKVAYL